LTKHVALVGFMGTGKSTLGSRLAGRIGSLLIDIDADLEGLVGPIPDYFEKHGEAAFRAVEASAVSDALLGSVPAVVVLGGGAVTSAARWESFRASASSG
jgi:shikimate kinase